MFIRRIFIPISQIELFSIFDTNILMFSKNNAHKCGVYISLITTSFSYHVDVILICVRVTVLLNTDEE